MTNLYTTDSVRTSLAAKYDTYFAQLSVGQSSTWKCDQRTADLYCLGQWLIDELTLLGCPDEDRRKQQWHFNRKCRAEDDIFAVAAKSVNDFLEGNIDKYKGR